MMRPLQQSNTSPPLHRAVLYRIASHCIAQPIKVDGRSLVDLKAIVYAKEQKVRRDGGGGSGSGLRGLRGKRPSGDRDGGGRKDPFARSNKGVEDRSQRDEEERMTTSKKRTAAQRVMAAKSSLYEKLGERELQAITAGGCFLCWPCLASPPSPVYISHNIGKV